MSKIIRTLNSEECKAMIQVAGRHSKRNALIMKLALMTGMRVGEISHARLENIRKIDGNWWLAIDNTEHQEDEKPQKVKIKVDEDHPGAIKGKNGWFVFKDKEQWTPKYNSVREVPIPEELVLEIMELAGDRTTGPLFLSERKKNGEFRPIGNRMIQKIYHDAALELGLRDTKIHTARHTYATKLKHKKVELTHIQHLLGHKNAKTTLDYIEALPMSPDEARAITTLIAKDILD